MRSYNEQIITLTYSCTRFESRNSAEEANNASQEGEKERGDRERGAADHVNGERCMVRPTRGRNQPDFGMWNCGSVALFLCDDSECGQVTQELQPKWTRALSATQRWTVASMSSMPGLIKGLVYLS